jgi:hypothetical protein
MSRVIAVVACGFTLAACSASLPSLSFLRSSPPTEALRIESEPPGAEAKTSLGQSCRTPCELVVQGADELSVTLALNGYQPQTIAVRKEPPRDGENAELRLAPNPVYVELQAVPATRAKKPVAAKKKKPVAAAQPAPAAPAAAAAPTGAPPLAPAPAVEAAASATNYPWPSR